jgi:hypothetical protein
MRIETVSGDGSRMIEKRWHRDSWQLQQNIELRVPELADDGGIEIVQLRLESQRVKRRLNV